MTDAQAWDFAVGMTRMAGLEPTQDFIQYIEKEKRGEVTMADIKQFLDEKYDPCGMSRDSTLKNPS